MSTTDNIKNQLILNRLNKTQYDEAAVNTDEFYFVDPLFKGNRILVTDNDGQIVEGDIGVADIPAVINTTTSVSTTDALSANMGREMQAEIDNLKARGRFLALWNCATGLPATDPVESPYVYKAGDYYIVGTVAASGSTNYEPTGSSYTTGVASTVVETAEVAVDDVYYYDGTQWKLQANTQKTVSFANIAGQPTDNTNLATALNSKVSDVQINSTSIVTSGVATIPVATNSSDGVSHPSPTYGTTMGSGGILMVSDAKAGGDSTITDKSSAYRPLTPRCIDLAVKTGVTTNTLPLNSSEQTTACNWLGASEQTSFVDWID